jgi:hypothetical protein
VLRKRHSAAQPLPSASLIDCQHPETMQSGWAMWLQRLGEHLNDTECIFIVKERIAMVDHPRMFHVKQRD